MYYRLTSGQTEIGLAVVQMSKVKFESIAVLWTSFFKNTNQGMGSDG